MRRGTRFADILAQRLSRRKLVVDGGEQNDDSAASSFRWEVFVLAGDPGADGLRTAPLTSTEAPPAAGDTYFAGGANVAELSAFANPDNLGFDSHSPLDCRAGRRLTRGIAKSIVQYA